MEMAAPERRVVQLSPAETLSTQTETQADTPEEEKG